SSITSCESIPVPYTTLFRSMIKNGPGSTRLPPHGPLNVALDVGLLDLFALVVQFSATADAQEHFGTTLFEIHLERNQGQTLLVRSEEHTSELQSRVDLVCRL